MLKITGGLVYDGLGGAPYEADVAVADGKICALGDLKSLSADQEIDARGLWVCPGFIDVHSHSDTYLLIEPAAPSKIFQGITTEVVGNCGASAAPRYGEYRLPSDWRDQTYPGSWQSVAEYRELLMAAKPAPNVVLLVGHNALRAGIMGYAEREATAAEIEAMQSRLRECLEAGACGLSTGLLYPPGKYAAMEEIVELAKVVAVYGGIYTTHMRSEGRHLLAALDETLAIGRRSGVRVEISHLKTSGRPNWGLLDEALAKIETAQVAGLEVAADRYPYTASSTDLDVLLPEWASSGGPEACLARLRGADVRQKLQDELAAASRDYEKVMVGATSVPDCQGKTLTEVAQILKMDPPAAIVDLLLADELKTSAMFFGMSEANMRRILALPYVMIGTDASVRALTGPLSLDHPHPRAYGTCLRFLLMAHRDGLVKPEEAIRKMTSLPAKHYRLAGRGVVQKGFWADLLVIDPAKLDDRSTYAKPHQLAQGVQAVVVNGVLTLQGGRLTGRRGGWFLG